MAAWCRLKVLVCPAMVALNVPGRGVNVASKHIALVGGVNLYFSLARKKIRCYDWSHMEDGNESANVP